MTKKLIQDIKVNHTKSIRQIKKVQIQGSSTIPIRKAEPVKEVMQDEAPKIFFPQKRTFFEEDFEAEPVSKNSHFFLWTVSIISIGALLFLFSLIFATASVIITPKSETAPLNTIYTITTNTGIPGLHYTILSVKKDLSKSLVTDGEEQVERKAIGKAILYNNFSTSKQRLINNTRLQTPDGAIYRIRDSVDVPGITTISGVKTPGQIEVEIIADVAGSQYNMKVSDLKGDFSIPGFKGTTKYTGFYGRLSADTTGGFVGTVKKVSEEKIAAGRDELKNALKADLIKDMYAELPATSTIFKNGYFIQTTDLPDNSSDANYSIGEESTLYAVVFHTNELSTFIANDKIKDLGNAKVDVLWDGSVSALISGTTVTPWTENVLKLNLSGNANIVWSYDRDAILSQIKGQNKSILKTILEKNTDSITEINASIRPQWKQTFPKDAKKITITDSVRDGLGQ